MSYEIVYDRTFVRTTRGIIPMILHGSSNCFDIINGREVPERYWSCWNDDLIEFSADKLHETLEKVFSSVLGDSSREMFQWHGKWLYGDKLEKWFQNGVRNAATLEEIDQANFGAGLTIRVMRVQPKILDTVLRSFGYIRTTEELEQSLDEAKALVKSEEEEGRKGYLHLFFSGRKPLNKPRRTKIEEPCLIKCKHGYFGNNNNRSTTFYSSPQMGRVFSNEEEAKKEIGAWFSERRLPYWAVKASSVLKEKPYAIYVASGPRVGLYLQKRTSSKIYFTSTFDHAWRFASQNDAVRTVEKTKQVFGEDQIGKLLVVTQENATECRKA